jgi:hypothetical protein
LSTFILPNPIGSGGDFLSGDFAGQSRKKMRVWTPDTETDGKHVEKSNTNL